MHITSGVGQLMARTSASWYDTTTRGRAGSPGHCLRDYRVYEPSPVSPAAVPRVHCLPRPGRGPACRVGWCWMHRGGAYLDIMGSRVRGGGRRTRYGRRSPRPADAPRDPGHPRQWAIGTRVYPPAPRPPRLGPAWAASDCAVIRRFYTGRAHGTHRASDRPSTTPARTPPGSHVRTRRLYTYMTHETCSVNFAAPTLKIEPRRDHATAILHRSPPQAATLLEPPLRLYPSSRRLLPPLGTPPWRMQIPQAACLSSVTALHRLEPRDEGAVRRALTALVACTT